MAIETELKLSLPPDAHQALVSSPVVERYSASQSQLRELFNLYYDTPDQALGRHRVALRIRRQDDHFIQTLKTRGASQGGLHQRQEWEWDIAEPRLQMALLPSGSLPADVDEKLLTAAFSTDFQRRVWVLNYPGSQGNSRIELVLDNGSVGAEGVSPGSDPISEIELELLDGEPQALFRLALELAESLPLRITRVSKAERGYRLLDPQRARCLPAPEMPWRGTVSALFAALLESLQAAIESFEYLDEAALLATVVNATDDLLALIAEPSLAVAESDQQTLAATALQLRRLAGPWLLQNGGAVGLFSRDDRLQRLQQSRELLRSQGWCRCLLRLSYRAWRLGTA